MMKSNKDFFNFINFLFILVLTFFKNQLYKNKHKVICEQRLYKKFCVEYNLFLAGKLKKEQYFNYSNAQMNSEGLSL